VIVMTHDADALGGQGLGPFWFADEDAAITDHPIYQQFSQMQVAGIDGALVKQHIGSSYASAEAAPILSYLRWLLATITDAS
jgi:hypothetical protein